MNESVTPHRSSLRLQPGSPSGAALVGVRGWLLVLCLMFTVVGPALSVWLMAHEYASAAPLGAKPVAVQAAVLVSLLLSACAVAFGAYAGGRLWLIRPNALGTARQALLFGLAVDVVTTAIQVATAQVPGDRLLFQVEVNLVPSLVFFTLCFTYLDRSRRVHATYGPQPADA
jgi:hypothetical protein